MTTFIMAALAALVLAFLVMIASQLIRIERIVMDLVDTCDARVSRMYEEPGS